MAQPLRVLLVGAGGREHALAWRLRQEDPYIEIIAAPGNPGISALAECVPVSATDIDGLLTLARVRSVTWTLVGPEAPLAAGLVNTFTAAGMPVFGPTRSAAMLETSKEFSKTLMSEAGVPTAKAFVCRTLVDANSAIDGLGAPVVVKASGLAAGKGVMVCATVEDARAAAAAMLEGSAFGEAGSTILIEEFMEGEELSLFAVTDGLHAIMLPPAQDHKRLLDGDEGPNTGGMGAYCPVSLVERHVALVDDVLERIVHPTLAAMRVRGTPFRGLLYVGLMITPSGPKVVEFNCRFGDPETQAVLPALSRDARLGELMASVARGEKLRGDGLLKTTRCAVSTVLAAPGYPEAPHTGAAITLPPTGDDIIVFHAGTRRGPDGSLVTNGGRVLAVTGIGSSPHAAHAASLSAANAITFPESSSEPISARASWRAVPELPETETIARDLDRDVGGARIVSAVVTKRDVLREISAPAFVKRVTGAVVDHAWRRAKLVILDLSTGDRLVVQPRFTGALLIDGGDLPESERRFSTIEMRFEDGRSLHYRDIRRLGTVALMSPERFATYVAPLGIEPLDPAFSAQHLSGLLRASRREIKKVLMDQRIVAGIGNIYANEALWRAGIDPSRAANAVSTAEGSSLRDAIVGVLTESIEQRGTSFRDYRDANGERGGFAAHLAVYGREGEACQRCGKRLIGTHAIDGRATVLCAGCQK